MHTDKSNCLKPPNTHSPAMNASANISINGTDSHTGGRPPRSKSMDDFMDALNLSQTVLTPILLLVGLVGNVFTILIVTDRRFKQMNCSIMLVGLAISDILMLLTSSLNQPIFTELSVDVRALSLFGCKLFFITYRSAKVSSSWIVVLIAVERFFAVVLPLRSKSWMCRRNVVIMMAIIYVVTIGLNILWSVTTIIRRGKCFASIASGHEQLNYDMVILRGIQYSFLPITILICVTPPIIYSLISAQTRRTAMMSGPAAARSAKEVSRTTLMLILVVVFHVIASMSFTILFIRNVFYGESIFTSSGQSFFKFFLVSPTLEQINHSMNFVIYVLFSRPFRRRVLELIRCGRRGHSEGEQSGAHGASPLNTIS